jgi:hypothetical protein
MPNFDGKGPLKRGRVIGRGQGPCPPANADTGSREATDYEPLRANRSPDE